MKLINLINIPVYLISLAFTHYKNKYCVKRTRKMKRIIRKKKEKARQTRMKNEKK
jgi:hypothetical protein